MKTFILLFCTTVFCITPSMLVSQSTTISIAEDKTVTVDEVFNIIDAQTDYTFIYPENLFKDFPVVSLKKGTANPLKLLKQIVANGNLNFLVTPNNTIIIRAKKQAQITTVKGVVTDEEGFPLPGVTVLVKDTTDGALTDFDGGYSIEVSGAETVLAFYYLGFVTQEIRVGAKSEINVVLLEDIQVLEEVVVVSDGYRTINKEREPGAYVSVTKKNIERQITNDIVGSLEGLVPGLTINNNTGTEAPSLFIRGIGSFNNTSPLFVLDGFPVRQSDLDLINPLDIESVTVLKDASAAAIWGSGAANGVIVVTTKKGKKGQDPVFRFNTSISIKERPSIASLNLMNSNEVINYERDFFTVSDPFRSSFEVTNRAYTSVYELLFDRQDDNITDTGLEQSLSQLAAYTNTKDLEQSFLNAPVTSLNNLTFTGHSDKLGYYGGLTYNTTETTLRGGENAAVKATFNTDYQFSKKTKVSIGVNYLNEEKTNSPISPSLLRTLPYETIFDENGNPSAIRRDYPQNSIDLFSSLGAKDLTYKPLNDFRDQEFKVSNSSLRLTAALNQKITDGLTASGSFQYVNQNSVTDNLYKENSYFTRNFLTSNSIGSFGDTPQTRDELRGITQLYPDGSILFKSLYNYYSLVGRVQLDFNKSYTDGKHIIAATLGLERRKYSPQTNTVPFYGYNEGNLVFALVDQSPPPYRNIFGVNETPLISSRISKFDERNAAYYFNSTYSFNRKYHLNVSARRDRSSQFTLGKQYFGAVGLKWNLAKEEYMSNKVQRLDLRVSWGVQGNSPDVGVSSISTTANPDINELTGANSLNIVFPPNFDLRFETVETTNLGIDFGLYKNKLTGSIEVYNKASSNVLALAPIDPTNGFSNITQNVAEINNKGLEAQVNTELIKTQNFQWNTNLAYTYFENQVLGSNISKTINNTIGKAVNLEGFPTYSLFAYENAGLNENTGAAQVFYTDPNGEKQITEDFDIPAFNDLVRVGSLIPNVGVDLSNTLQYKNLQLFFRFAYKGGHLIKKDNITTDNGLQNYNKALLNYWQNPGDENTTAVPSLQSQLDFSNRELANNTNTQYVAGDFIRLRQLILSYSLNHDIIKKTPFNHIDLALQADNLWYWAKNDENIDPEAYNPLGGRSLEITPNYSMRLTLGF